MSVASSKIGESEVLALVSATSSFTGCSLQQTNTPMASECLNNFLNYDQPIQVDLATGQLFLNSSDQKSSYKAGSRNNNKKLGSLWDTSFGTASSTSFSSNLAHSLKKVATKQMSAKDAGAVPMVPFKDSGIYSKDRVLMNLCDGTNSYDNTGIIPMINAMQVYEKPSDLANKTYNILYFDGPDSEDQSNPWPSDDHFAKLFKDTHSGFGLNIFEQDVTSYKSNTWRSAQFPDPSPGGASGNQVWVDVYYYEGLTTMVNDFCNVQAGIKFNILVLAPHSQLNTLYEVPANLDPNATGFEGIDYHANVNAILVECFLDLERKYKLFSNTYNSYVCDPSSKTCSSQVLPSGAVPQSLAACMQSCGAPPPMYKCDATKGCVQDSSGTYKTADCDQSCKAPPKYICTNNACTVSTDPSATELAMCQASCNTFGCKNSVCTKGAGSQSLQDCQKSSCEQPTPTPTPPTPSGLAAWQIALIVIACIVVILGIVLLVWRIKKAKKQSKMKNLQQHQTSPPSPPSPSSPYKLSSKKARSKRKHS